MKLRPRNVVSAAIAWLTGLAGASAQMAPLVSHDYPMPVDSGLVQSRKAMPADGQAPELVYSTEVRVPGVPWLRLAFDEATLSGTPEAGDGSYLIITSMRDHAFQRLDGRSIREWSNTSAYFNGDAVRMELFAFPRTGGSRITMSHVTGGLFGAGAGPDDICGATDDRTLSSFPAQGRIVPIGCTGWLISNGNCANRFLSAGHCFNPAPGQQVVEFNVPLSTSTGAIVHPPPEHQYSVNMATVQATVTVIGNDWSQFFTSANSNTGLHARDAQGGAAYSIGSAPAVAGQTFRVTGYGTTNPNDPAGGGLPLSQTQVQKTHTGAYTLLSGTRIEYTVDTSGGNSGSPVVNGTGPSGTAIGIHTNAGCASGGANSGTAIQNAGLQAALAAPLGTCAPYTNPTCLQSLFATNNNGSAGGAVYFDVAVSSGNDIEVTNLYQNVSGSGTSFNVVVYITPDTSVGKETTPLAWTQVATGSGVGESADTPVLIALSNRFTLHAGKNYGVAIRSNVLGHSYTNGTGSNQVYSDTGLTMTLGSATNVAFSGSLFSPRVWNGRLCYRSLPASGQCLDTIFASNNSGSSGGAVYFDANVSGAANLAVTGLTLNAGANAPAGTAFSLSVYTKAGTYSGFETNAGAWTLRATGSGVTAATNSPTSVTLNSWFTLGAGTTNGVALVMSAAANNAYTTGTGSNQVYSNSNLTISTGSATNVPFTGPVNTPRVFNGSLCYAVGVTGCPSARYAQSPPNPSLGGFNSNAATSVSPQQIADSFTVSSNSTINGLRLWAIYTGNRFVPVSQSFTINIYADSGGNPGAAPLYTTNVSAPPVETGLLSTGFLPARLIYQFDLSIPNFSAAAGTTYWLSPLGTSTGMTWCWSFITNPALGSLRARDDTASPWNSFANSTAFEVCGVPACYANCDGSTVPPILNANDFQCFLNRFAAGEPYANCDGSTVTPVLNANDFQCFLNAFAAGCS